MNKQAKFSIARKPAVAALSTFLILSTFSITSAIAGSEQMPEAKTADANSATNKTSTEDKIPDGAEKDAWMLLKAAHDARQVMPSNFEGFDAKVVFTQDDTKYNGTMSYRKSTGTKIDVHDLKGEPLEWLTDKLASFIGHRRGDSFAEGDGRNPITFGAEDKSPYGRLVELHDRLNSKYRIKDNKVREVTRTTPESTFTISVIETMEADPGMYLSKHFVVSYRNLIDKNLEQVDGFRDDYDKLDGVWLPQRRVVLSVTRDKESPVTRVIDLSDVKVIKD